MEPCKKIENPIKAIIVCDGGFAALTAIQLASFRHQAGGDVLVVTPDELKGMHTDLQLAALKIELKPFEFPEIKQQDVLIRQQKSLINAGSDWRNKANKRKKK